MLRTTSTATMPKTAATRSKPFPLSEHLAMVRSRGSPNFMFALKGVFSCEFGHQLRSLLPGTLTRYISSFLSIGPNLTRTTGPCNNSDQGPILANTGFHQICYAHFHQEIPDGSAWVVLGTYYLLLGPLAQTVSLEILLTLDSQTRADDRHHPLSLSHSLPARRFSSAPERASAWQRTRQRAKL